MKYLVWLLIFQWLVPVSLLMDANSLFLSNKSLNGNFELEDNKRALPRILFIRVSFFDVKTSKLEDNMKIVTL